MVLSVVLADSGRRERTCRRLSFMEPPFLGFPSLVCLSFMMPSSSARMGPWSPSGLDPRADGSEVKAGVVGRMVNAFGTWASNCLARQAVAELSCQFTSEWAAPFPGPGSAQLPSWPQGCFVINQHT